jgi:microsomal dipeptidase-like Zn-dependent dipeptidase
VIADLHCHFPMHLVHAELEPHGAGLWRTALGELEQQAFDLAARAINSPDWDGGFRVDLAGLQAGGVGLVCSVLYWPPAELLPGDAGRPKPGSFEHLLRQLDDVEAHLADQVVVRTTADLDRVDGLRFVHCVEGGFHLGGDAAAMDANVAELSSRGVLYVTLAHLVFRGVAANAPAIPPLTDAEYRAVFHQDDGIGLTDLGRAAVAAMVAHRVLVDVSHMRQDALDDTFALLDELDPGRALPVIASHVGARAAAPEPQDYNLAPDTMRRIAARAGVIARILAAHLFGHAEDEAAARAIVAAHVRAIHDALGTHDHTAIGTDLDGFIKPTLTGLQRAADLARLETWIREDFPEAADAILHANADRVIRRTFALRG